MEIRSFLAFELPPDIKRVVSETSAAIKQLPLDARWVKADHIHLTIVFLGSVPEGQIQPLGETVRRVCQTHAPFRVALGGLGLFSSGKVPRVLWIGMTGDMERMAGFRDELQEALAPFHVRSEKRRFKAHLTLGRFRKGARSDPCLVEALHRFEALTSPICELRELVLYRSDLNPEGVRYTRLGAWPLGGKAPGGHG